MIRCWAVTYVPSLRTAVAMDWARAATSGWSACRRALVSESVVVVPGARGSDTEVADALGPVVLVVVLRDDDLRCAGLRGCGRGSRSAVVDDGCDAFEQLLLVDLADGQAVGFVVHECQVGPPTGYNRTASERTGRLYHHLSEVYRRADAAEADVDGRFAGVEEFLQLGGEWTLIRQDPGAGLEHGLVCGIGPGPQRRASGEPGPVGQDVAAHATDRGKAE